MRVGSEKYHTTTLGECCEIVSGSTPRRDHPEYWHGDIPWATPRDLSRLDTPTLAATEECITKAGYDSCSTQLLPAGSVLFSSRAPVGLVAIAGTPVCTNQGFKSLVPGPDLDSGYLYWFLKGAANRIADSGNGTTFAEVSKEAMSRVRISFPPLTEQRRIAALLDRADVVRRKREESRRLVDELLRSVFLEMFGDPVRNEKGWEVVRLEAVVARNAGIKAGPFGSSLTKSMYASTGYRVYGQEQVLAGTLTTGDYFVSDELFRELGAYAIAPGDVLMSLVGSYGRVLVVPEDPAPGIINPRLLRIRLDPTAMRPGFLAALLMQPSLQRQMKAMAHGGTMGVLNATLLKALPVMTPPVALQDEFLRAQDRITLGLVPKYEAGMALSEAVSNALGTTLAPPSDARRSA